MYTIGMRVSTVLVGLAAVLVAGCVDGNSIGIAIPNRNVDQREQFEWTGMISPGQTLEIKGVVGSIHAAPASGADIEVVAEKRSDWSDLRDVTIEIVQHADGVTICAVYPSQAGAPQNVCKPGDWGQFTTENNNDVEVEFTVLVSRGVLFTGRTIVGNVEADDMSADVLATTITGSVRVRTDGVAEASTITGSVSAYIGSARWPRDLAFGTVTGDIFVEIPSTTNADVEVSAFNGRITSDFPLMEVEMGKRRGTIGAGGPNLDLSTITGSVTLKGRF